jgi:hypothetical protein
MPLRPRCPINGNPTSVVSLGSVLVFTAEDFCQSVSLIAQFYQQVRSGQMPQASALNMIAGEMGTLQRHCEALGLNSTLAQIKRVKYMLFEDPNRNWTLPILTTAIMEITSRLTDELEARKVYIVSADRNPYISGNQFDTSVADRFPDAIPDMDEAARCFAFERPTACIFHLMRVTEFALREIARLLGIEDHAPTWEPIIRKIDAELKEDYKKRKFKGSQDLLANMSTHLHAVKVAWRNKTMHVEKVNTMEHAREIYDATTGLMRYLAANLPQKQKGIIQTIREKLAAK